MAKRQRKHFHNDLRLKRKEGFGYVLFRGDEAHPKSTQVPATEPESAAIAVAYAMMHRNPTIVAPLLRDFAADFYTDQCAWTRRAVHGRRQRDFNPFYIPNKRRYLVNYVLPRFGWVRLDMLGSRDQRLARGDPGDPIRQTAVRIRDGRHSSRAPDRP